MLIAASIGEKLIELYRALFECYGPQHWWPAEEPFEVVVGAILTQSAAWGNVEKAITNLKAAGVMSPEGLQRLSRERLAQLIYPTGYYNAKAIKLKAFVARLWEAYDGQLSRFFALDRDSLRRELLSIHGVGEETADSIILYAARKPIFVIDAYTRRIMARLGLASINESYGNLQRLFMANLPADEGVFNEYHALFVRHGKQTCRREPCCYECCLSQRCPIARPLRVTSED